MRLCGRRTSAERRLAKVSGGEAMFTAGDSLIAGVYVTEPGGQAPHAATTWQCEIAKLNLPIRQPRTRSPVQVISITITIPQIVKIVLPTA